MIKLTVSRHDNIYECFPDIAQAPDGTLVCVYRECMGHAPYPFSRLVVRRSSDEGRNWTPRQILIECISSPASLDENRSWLEPDALAGYEESRERVPQNWQVGSTINCSRLTCLADGTLFLLADFASWDEHNEVHWTNRLWRSKDNGRTWQGPQETTLAGLVPSITQLRNGDILVGLVNNEQENAAFVCRSTNGGDSWSQPILMPSQDQRIADEISYVELDDGIIVGFGRNLAAERARRPSAGVKVISNDGGQSWQGPFETWLMGLTGRPKAGLLRSGEVCVTYRCELPNEMLAMHVMTQQAAKFTELGDLVERQPMPQDIPIGLTMQNGQDRPWYLTSYYPGRTVILDIDRSVHRDAGYSGWVQLDNGDIYVVDYINDDAPLAQIRGYLVSRSDYILFPEGDLPWLHPSWQPFRAMTLAIARQQTRTNQKP